MNSRHRRSNITLPDSFLWGTPNTYVHEPPSADMLEALVSASPVEWTAVTGEELRASLLVQWLRLGTSGAGRAGYTCSQGTVSHSHSMRTKDKEVRETSWATAVRHWVSCKAFPENAVLNAPEPGAKAAVSRGRERRRKMGNAEWLWLPYGVVAVVRLPSCVRLCVITSMFSRQEYWSRLPSLLQGIFPTQGSNSCLLHLLHWPVGSLPLCSLGSLYIFSI